MKIGFLLCGAMLLTEGSALAAIATSPATLSTTSSAIYTYPGGPTGQLGPTTSYLLLKNESATDSIACKLGYSSLPTAVLNTAGNITLTAGQEQVLATTQLRGSFLACVGTGADPMTFIVD
jgi:hypothetical protein